MEKVVVITGPTGVGKTALSIEIAKKFNAEIINCDASQFKRGLNIGTAKINKDEMDGVIHHLIDNLNINDEYTVKEYQTDARNLIKDISTKGCLPLLVGGTGLYISSTLFDYHFEESKIVDESIYEEYSNTELHQMLSCLDPKSAEQIHENNRRRVIRAIEIAKNQSTLLSENKDGNKPLYQSLIICLNCDRDLLYNRINQRFQVMIDNGWIEECKELKQNGINLKEVKDIGYSDIDLYLDNEISFDELSEIVKKKTRNYAKRQLTWFRNKLDCIFVNVNYLEYDKTIEEVSSLINNFLKK